MDEALIGLVGIVVGVLLGGTGTYFRLRRDLWTDARANGLILLAEVRALRARADDQVLADTLLGTDAWDARREALLRFRRGNYPSGLKTHEWLWLAGHFEALRSLTAVGVSPADTKRWTEVKNHLRNAEEILVCFRSDAPVFPYVVATGVREGWKAYLGLTILGLATVLWALDELSWLVALPVFVLAIVIAARWVGRTGR